MITPSNPTRLLGYALACCLVLAGCKREDASTDNTERIKAPAKSIARQPASPAASATGRPGKKYDPAHPPIDCPLRTQGIDPSHMRPFKNVERYIAFLERKDRADWQKPDQVISALGLSGNETVVDLGAGSGYFAFRFAKALPRGRVIAADVEPEMIRHIHHKVMAEGVQNIKAMLIKADAPAVPNGVNLVFICDVLHHVSNRPAWLAKITKVMRSGARLVLIEFKEGKLPQGPPESMKIPRKELVKLVTDAGLVLATEHAKLLPYQTFLVFRKP